MSGIEGVEMTEKKIHLVWDTEERMSVSLLEPGEGSEAIVLFCHGFMSRKESETNQRLGEHLRKKGIASACFDFWGHGEDEHPFREITLTRCLGQLEALLAWADARYLRIGLLGSSFGGLAAIHAAARHPGIAALGLKCPVSNYPPIWRDRLGEAGMVHWREAGCLSFMSEEGRARLDYRFFEDLLKYNTYSDAAKIVSPTHIVHGSADEDVPCSQSERLHHILQSKKELTVIEGADHPFSKHEDFEKMLKVLEEWLVQKMKCAPGEDGFC